MDNATRWAKPDRAGPRGSQPDKRRIRQGIYNSTQLHRAVGESHVFMNYAIWEPVDHFKAAFSHPDFRAALGAYPSSALASPHLFEKLAVPKVCTT